MLLARSNCEPEVVICTIELDYEIANATPHFAPLKTGTQRMLPTSATPAADISSGRC